MEIVNKKDDPFGPRYIINDELSISRNHYKGKYGSPDADGDESTPYYLTNAHDSDNVINIALTEEQMLEVVAAFLMVYESYDHPEGTAP